MLMLPGGGGQDIPAALGAIATAYRDLEAENKALREELDRARTPLEGHDSDLAPGKIPSYVAPMTSVLSSWGSPSRVSTVSVEGTRWRHMSSNFRVNEFHLIGEKRNAERARLQSLINDLDPEERGAWATKELTVEFLMRTLVQHGKSECDVSVVAEILEALKEHFAPALATGVRFINLTSFEQIETIFGRQRAEDVMNLQDAVAWDIKNSLVYCDLTQSMTPLVCARPEASWCRRLGKMVRAAREKPLKLVEIIGAAVVVLNTVVLGVSTDFRPDWQGWDFISASLAFAFVVEIALRIVLGGGLHEFFTGSQRAWNAFETVIVAVAVFDVLTIMARLQDGHSTQMLTLCRMVRLVRLTRIARLGRMGIFHELSYMLRGIEAGTSTLVWALLLLMVVCYAGGIFLTQTIGSDDTLAEQEIASVHFSTIGRSMFTLFRCFTGDCSTQEGRPIVYPLQDHYGVTVPVLYCSALMVVSFGLFNVMIASFVQSSMRASKFNDIERRRVLKRERKMVKQKTVQLIDRIRALYATWVSRKADLTPAHSLADMRITREMFATFLEDPEIQRWFEDMGCEESLRGKLFDKIDRDGNGVLDGPDVVTGVVDILRGRFDNLHALTSTVQAVHSRLVQMEAVLLMRHQHGREEARDDPEIFRQL